MPQLQCGVTVKLHHTANSSSQSTTPHCNLVHIILGGLIITVPCTIGHVRAIHHATRELLKTQPTESSTRTRNVSPPQWPQTAVRSGWSTWAVGSMELLNLLLGWTKLVSQPLRTQQTGAPYNLKCNQKVVQIMKFKICLTLFEIDTFCYITDHAGLLTWPSFSANQWWYKLAIWSRPLVANFSG